MPMDLQVQPTQVGPMGDVRPEDVQATFCKVIVDEWIRQGVRYAAISPGSRSTPLALALMRERESKPDFVVEVFHDERSTAFAVLGSALASGSPGVAVCTSGTAAAHFHAAVVEAGLSAIPMIVCTADRPSELRDVGAPQTIDQTMLYGRSVRWYHDPGVPTIEAAPTWRSLAARAYWHATGRRPGPVHLNLPFREPLVGRPLEDVTAGHSADDPAASRVRRDGVAELSAGDLEELAGALGGRRGVVVAGRDCGQPAKVESLARALGWPVLAEPRAGCGAGTRTILHFDALLRVPAIAQALRPQVVLRLGDPPASKVLSRWVASSGASEIHVAPTDKPFDPDHRIELRLVADSDPLLEALTGAVAPCEDESWWQQWHESDLVVRQVLDEFDRGGDSWNAALAVRHVMRRIPRGSHVVVSSSMPIRDVEWFAGDCSTSIVHSNRGANGIDGVIATAAGVAGASRRPTYALIGDVAAIHDASTLLTLSSRNLDVRIVVVNNDGGGIFHHLPQATAVDGRTFEEMYGTPHGVDFSGMCSALGMTTFDVGAPGEDMDAALRTSGPSLVQLRTDRSGDVDAHRRIHAEVAARFERGGVS